VDNEELCSMELVPNVKMVVFPVANTYCRRNISKRSNAEFLCMFIVTGKTAQTSNMCVA